MKTNLAGPAAELRITNLVKRFGTAAAGANNFMAVDNVSLTVPPGSFFAMLGPSGCGKTTTLRMVAGLEQPTSGEILLNGKDITHLKPYHRPVNTVFQNYALFPHLTVHENVAFGLRRKGEPDIAKRVDAMLELVQLNDFGARRPAQLSGGQQQRVALARALINAPQVLLLDEPLGALDLKLRRQMQLELKRIQTEVSTTFVHVTHDQEEAMTMADTIAVMRHGRVEQLASPVDLYERPATAFVANFLGKSNLLEGRVTGTDGALLLVETHGVALRLPAANRPATTTNDLLVGVRPEKLHMAAAGAQLPTSHNKLQATVTDSSFMGVSTQYVVRTAWQQELTVFTQNLGIDGMRARDTVVQLHWDPQHTFAVPRTGALPETEEET